jgi:hypothetical protein
VGKGPSILALHAGIISYMLHKVKHHLPLIPTQRDPLFSDEETARYTLRHVNKGSKIK